MSNFTHLHLHTEYSMLDGANKIKELANILKERGVKSVAITDHGNMFGAIDFYKTMKKNGIKPIIGLEAYLHNNENLEDKSTKQRFHVILLAKNEIGYKNLMYLSSMSYIKGFYYYPRINKKLLKEYSEGIICCSACLQGEVNWHLNLSERNLKFGAKGYEKAKEVAKEYKEIFGDDFYLEIMRHGIEDQKKIDDQILRLAKELDIKFIATNDTHYTFKERAAAHEVFMCIAMNKNLDDPNRLRHSVHEFFVKTDNQMNRIFADIPEAITNTQEIADKCNLEIKLGDPTPPNFKFTLEYAKKEGLELPESNETYSLENDRVLFKYLSHKGLKERLKFINESEHEEYKKRLELEIDTINSMKFPGYMLIVSDFINHAKQNGIPVGPGRGSAAGSLVAYALKITDIDPIPYNLLFERFLNPERISMPDIDIDFCQNRRGEVIDYVIEKYGKYNVAQVATFGKLLAKGVIRDVARVCDMPYKEADAMAKLIPDELKITLNGELKSNGDVIPGAFQKEPKINELIQRDSNAKRVWEFAKDLEGLNRNAGMHAAGVVISNEELWQKTPLFKQTNSEDGHFVTQYAKDFLEDVDLIKFDFLGLKTLTVIDNAIKLIKYKYKKDIIWEEIDFNEKEVYKTIQSGNTLGIFQIESGGMQQLATELKPDCFEDIIAMIALYRPGPMGSGMDKNFIKRKHGFEKIDYTFKDLKEILAPTYGVIVYQEQVMQIVRQIGGFSLGEADLIRRAMSKKKEDEMIKLKNEYLIGAKKNGYDVAKADNLFELIMKFAEYGFNKSHSAAYALITFQTAYLKTHYPAEFMAAIITSEENRVDKVVKYIDECKRLNIKLLPPSINNSFREFSVIEDKDGKSIVYGFGGIKGVGLNAIEHIIEVRQKDGNFTSLDDFVSRVDNFKVNKKVFDNFIKSGTLDEFKFTRMNLLRNVEKIIDTCKDSSAIQKNAANSLFGEIEDMSKIKVNIVDDKSEFSLKELLSYEKESLGIYISGHPLDDFADEIRQINYTLSSNFDELDGNSEILSIGKIEDINSKITKNGNKMGILNILDFSGTFEAIAFSGEFKKVENLTEEDLSKPFGFRLSVNRDGQKTSLFLRELYKLEELKDGIKLNRSTKKQFSQKKAQIDEYVKQIRDLKFQIDLSKLNKLKINEIFNEAYKQTSLKDSSHKLTLEIIFDERVFLYSTNFLVNDEFEDFVNSLLND